MTQTAPSKPTPSPNPSLTHPSKPNSTHPLALPVQLDPKDHKAPKAQPVRQAPLVPPEHKVPKARQVTQANPEPLAHKVLPVPLAPKAPQDRKV